MSNNKNIIKVLHITSGISTEGIGTFVLNAFEHINKEKVEMSLALATDWKQHHEDRIKKQGGKIYRTAEIGKGVPGIVKHFVNLIRLLKKEGPFDVVHSHMDFFNGLNVLAAFIAGVPIRISHAHLSVDKKLNRLHKRIYNSTMKFLISMFANYKLGCSKKANDYMNDLGFRKNKSKILMNGIDLNRFSLNRGQGRLSIPNLNKDKINFITIGRIDVQKNPLFIVEIIKELSKIRDDIHLYWIGTGSLENEVKRLVNTYKLENLITFLGTRDDVDKILSSMDFMLFPSKWEGLGIVLIEAQASGVPCFISDVIPNEADLGMCTVIKLHDDEMVWARKINRYINTESYNKNINKAELRKFDIENTTKELERFYLRTSYGDI